jgi:hypothetical protein
MRIHQNIPGVVANWPLQSNMGDGSGNGLDFAAIISTPSLHTPIATPPFVPVGNNNLGVFTPDGCIKCIDLESGSWTAPYGYPQLWAPLTPLLQFTGPFTFQWINMQIETHECTYFTLADPASGRIGDDGSPPQPYTLYSSSGNPLFADQQVHDALPNPTYSTFPGYADHTLFNWADVGRPQSGDYHVHVCAWTRDVSGNYQVYRDGVAIGAAIPSIGAHTVTGAERFFVGGLENGGNHVGYFASIRVLNYARTAAQILADATDVLSACSPSSGCFTVSTPLATLPLVVGQTYQTQLAGLIDIGSVTLTSINLATNSVCGTWNGGWIPQPTHTFVFSTPIGDSFAIEAVGMLVGIERGLGRLPQTNRIKP